MPLPKVKIEVPLFVGMGEGSDAQNRQKAAVVSENVSFDKLGAVETRKGFQVVSANTPNGNTSLVPVDDSVVVLSETRAARYKGGSLQTLIGYNGAVDVDDVYLGSGEGSSAWFRVVPIGGNLLITWLAPTEEVTGSSEGRLSVWFRLFDEEGRPLNEGIELREGVGWSYYLLSTGDNSAAVVSTNEDDEVYIDTISSSGAALALYTLNKSSLFASSERIMRICVAYDDTRDDYYVGVVTGYTWTGSNVQRGRTGFAQISSAGSLLASSELDDGTSSSNHYGGGALLVMGAAPSGIVWVAAGDYHDAFQYVYTFDGSLTVTAGPTAADSVYSWYAYHSGAGPTTEGDSWGNGDIVTQARPGQIADGRFVFDEGIAYLVTHGYRKPGNALGDLDTGPVTLTSPETTYGLLGSQVNRLGASPSSGTVVVFPNVTLAGDPWVEGGTIRFPCTAEEAWHYTNPTVAGTGDKLFPVGLDEDALLGIVWEILARPSYSVSGVAVANPTAGIRYITTVFGYDEAVRHSELVRESEPTGSDPAPYSSAILVSGGSVGLSNGKRALLTPRRRITEPAPYAGDGIPGGKYRIGWGVAGCLSLLGDPVVAGGAETLDLPVLSTGTPATIDNDRVHTLTFPLPPVVSGVFLRLGTGSESYDRDYKFCWAWVDARGIRHRGPLSQTYTFHVSSWDPDVDRLWLGTAPPPPLTGFSSDVFLEVYANEVDSSHVVGDQFLLVNTLKLPSYNVGEPFSFPLDVFPTSGAILPLEYTTGGELPNESVISSGGTVFAANRVWVFKGEKVFYSKLTSDRTPVAFNQNLFVPSPDGREVTGICSLDEQIIGFTKESVFLLRGRGPNNLGAGQDFAVHTIPSPSGCASYRSITSTEAGVFFCGNNGVYLLDRGMSVSFIGRDVEDSLDPTAIIRSYYDKEAEEVVFSTSDGQFCYFTPSGAWTHKRNFVLQTDEVWTPALGPIACSDGFLWGIDLERVDASDDAYPVSEYLPLKHSTPWISLDTQQGYQRAYRFLIRGKAVLGERTIPADYSDLQNPVPAYTTPETRTYVTFKVFVDHEDEPSHVFTKDLRTLSKLDPLELNIPVGPRQKCEAIRLQIETEQSSMWLRLTSVVLVAGRKPGKHRPNNASDGT